MKISTSISYHTFDGKIYVHNVDTQSDYILDGVALNVLNFFAKHPNVSAEQAAYQIAVQLDAEKFPYIQIDLYELIESLHDAGILIGDEDDSESAWEIVGEVERAYAARHKLFSLSLELPKSYSEDELTLEEYKNILEQAREMGVIRIYFSGKDILIRPDLCDLVEHAVKLGFIVDVHTAGAGMTDENFDKLCAAKLNSISFNLYGGTATVHDKITGVKGSFEKILKSLLMFKSAGVHTVIRGVVTRQNVHGLKSLCELGRRLKIRVEISPRISGHEKNCVADYKKISSLDLNYEKNFSRELTADQFNELAAGRLCVADNFNVSFKIASGNEKKCVADDKKIFVPDLNRKKNSSRELTADQFDELANGQICLAGKNTLAVNPYGEIRPCVEFRKSLGSLRTDSLKSLWNKIGGMNAGNE